MRFSTKWLLLAAAGVMIALPPGRQAARGDCTYGCTSLYYYASEHDVIGQTDPDIRYWLGDYNQDIYALFSNTESASDCTVSADVDEYDILDLDCTDNFPMEAFIRSDSKLVGAATHTVCTQCGETSS